MVSTLILAIVSAERDVFENDCKFFVSECCSPSLAIVKFYLIFFPYFADAVIIFVPDEACI